MPGPPVPLQRWKSVCMCVCTHVCDIPLAMVSSQVPPCPGSTSHSLSLISLSIFLPQPDIRTNSLSTPWVLLGSIIYIKGVLAWGLGKQLPQHLL